MPKREVWHPADYDQADVRAIQALANYAQLAVVAWNEQEMGPAPEVPSPFEVKRALDWIINNAAQTYDTSFVADDANGRVGAFVEGRRSVGMQLVKLMRLKADVVKK
ncbi:hypothetical protein [Aquamicrobium sp.]|uniref:hypothetical protein n=1 Tax=Aquamicrobium sp. TaxID=1872579 RepID=UPI0025873085|nr:hypothetical protein [Aquamicrobium sp.]MCK9549133.1 hypothetical protein [Aquamicrobium sp.]